MSRKMSIAREIRVQKLQSKNKMVGQTFNPRGHTSESLQKKEADLVAHYQVMHPEERQNVFNQFKSIEDMKREKNLYFSNSFEHNVFMRHFRWQFSPTNQATL